MLSLSEIQTQTNADDYRDLLQARLENITFFLKLSNMIPIEVFSRYWLDTNGATAWYRIQLNYMGRYLALMTKDTKHARDLRQFLKDEQQSIESYLPYRGPSTEITKMEPGKRGSR
jgi:hypothetical protein